VQHFSLSSAPSSDARDAQVAVLAASHDDHALAAKLQSIGIAAGVVQDIEDMMERDPQLASQGALITLDHPLLGPFAHIRTPITLSNSTVTPYRAPRMGEHSHSIARELSGLSPARIAELEAAGVFK
jgi:crotonobetainyl-CoA:carnitine CoA-transferase CaiB-like acyl-CoA transferase